MKQTHLRVGIICAVKSATALEAAIAHSGHKVQALSFGIQVGTGVLLLVNMLRLQAVAHQPDCSESGGVLGGLAGLGGNDGPNGPNGLDWSVGRGSRDGRDAQNRVDSRRSRP